MSIRKIYLIELNEPKSDEELDKLILNSLCSEIMEEVMDVDIVTKSDSNKSRNKTSILNKSHKRGREKNNNNKKSR